MKKANRLLILAVLLIAAGIWLLYGNGHGNVGLALAYPLSGTKFSIDITVIGAPVLSGMPLLLIGAALLLVAFGFAIMEQFGFKPGVRPKHTAPEPHGPVTK